MAWCSPPPWWCCTRPGTGCPYQAWPGGCWRWASWPLWRRMWRTAGPADRSAPQAPGRAEDGEDEVNTAAVAAYRVSLESGTPLSERKLAAMFGKTSRRWAHHRIAEARRVPVSAVAEP